MISIIIVGFNSKKYLKDCLSSIEKSTHKPYRVIFVDNKSQDGSVSFIRENFPKTIIIENKENYGFAKGNNIGIKKAIELGGDYIFLLNPDTIIAPNCLQLLAEHASKDTILQPLILLFSNQKTNLVNTTGNHLNYLGISYCGDYKKQANSIKDKDITSASGAAMFVPVPIIRRIGAFDESFFMYHEDLDLCWRARMAGFNVRLISRALVWHKYNFSRNKLKYYYIERNRWLFMLKNYELKTTLLILPMLFLNEILMLAYSIVGGWFLLKLSSSLYLIKHPRHIIAARKQAKRVVLDRSLKQFFSPQINFPEVKIPLIGIYSSVSKYYWKLINKLI